MKPKFENSFLVCFSFIALFLICIPSTVQEAAGAGLSGPFQVSGVGSEAQGAGIAFVNLDSNSRPEIVLMAYDNTYGTKYFRYKIGWNVSTSGVASSWSPVYQVASVGSEARGAGIAIVNLDSNPRPEMILMSYNDASGTKVFRYKIGWNVSTSGVASSWSSTIQVAGVGSDAQGAGIAFVNLDSNSRPEIILLAYDNTSGTKSFRYKIGWNVSTSGVASSWSPVYQVAGVGSDAQGAGIAIANLDSNPLPDMILMAENSPLGGGLFRYKIGWNVNTSGVASSLSPMYQGGLGSDAQTQGADLAIYDINGDGKQDMVLMAYDNPVGLNYFRYMILWDFMSMTSPPSGFTTILKTPTDSTTGAAADLYIIEPPAYSQ